MCSTCKFTGIMVLVVGALFLLRDLGINIIGEISGWTIVLVVLGATLIAGTSLEKHCILSKPALKKPAKKRKKKK